MALNRAEKGAVQRRAGTVTSANAAEKGAVQRGYDLGYKSKVGSFNIDPAVTVGNTQAITDVDFQPKIVLFWWSGSTGTGDTVAGGTYNIGFGAAIDSTHRFCAGGISEDAQADSDSLAFMDDDQCITMYTDTGTLDGIADFSSMDSGGFTLVIDDQFTQAYRVSYLALGGADLTNVYIGNKQMPTSTGNYSIEGVGFRPDAILTTSIYTTTLDTTYAGLYFSLGMATGSSNQGVVEMYVSDAAATSNTRGYGYNGEINSRGTSHRDTVVSLDADGFTLNHLEGASALFFIYIALKGGQYSVGDLTTRTDGNDISETVGFQPVAVLFASANRALSTQDAVSNHARISIGAATSASDRACAAISDETGLDDTETAYANYDSAVYANVADDAIVALMDIKSIESDGFTCVMDDADPSACWVMYLAIGAAGEPSTITDDITAYSVIKRSRSGSFTGKSAILRTLAGSITGNAALERTRTGTVTADAGLLALLAKSISANTFITWIAKPVWVSPVNLADMARKPALVFEMPASLGNMHFHMQLDTADTFDTGDLREYKTNQNLTGWEYYDGDSWEPFPAAGVANTYSGNQARYTVQTDLDVDTWYRRVRGGSA